MGNKIMALTCPSCGSADVSMLSDTQGKCNICGSGFIIEHDHENPSEPSLSLGDIANIVRYRIEPQYSPAQFLRAVWIYLAKNDAPPELFSGKFEKIETDRCVYIGDSVDVDVDYHASVGYCREEPYTDTETYYEDEPYIATERYYDAQIKDFRERQVTKYRSVRKERPVTKYKQVTDWSAFSGQTSLSSVTAICLNDKSGLDGIPVFSDRLSETDDESVILSPGDNEYDCEISSETNKMIAEDHKYYISLKLERLLPGDRCRDLSFRINKVYNKITRFYNVPFAQTSIVYKGKQHEYRALLFGKLKVYGDVIKNEAGFDDMKKKMKDESDSRIADRRKEIEKRVSSSTTLLSLITIIIIVSSILASLFIRSYAIIVGLFVLSLAALIFNNIVVNQAENREMERAASDIKAEKDRLDADVSDCQSAYRRRLLDALNEQLASFGAEPADIKEVFGED